MSGKYRIIGARWRDGSFQLVRNTYRICGKDNHEPFYIVKDEAMGSEMGSVSGRV